MRNRRSSGTSLFLMELIIAILFFALAGAVCIQLFVASHIVSENSVDLNHAVLYSQNVAEAFYGCNGDISEMAVLFPEGITEHKEDGNDTLILLFDQGFQPIDASLETEDAISAAPPLSEIVDKYHASFWLSARIIPDKNNLKTCLIQVNKLNEANNIYELEATLFEGKEAVHE